MFPIRPKRTSGCGTSATRTTCWRTPATKLSTRHLQQLLTCQGPIPRRSDGKNSPDVAAPRKVTETATRKATHRFSTLERKPDDGSLLQMVFDSMQRQLKENGDDYPSPANTAAASFHSNHPHKGPWLNQVFLFILAAQHRTTVLTAQGRAHMLQMSICDLGVRECTANLRFRSQSCSSSDHPMHARAPLPKRKGRMAYTRESFARKCTGSLPYFISAIGIFTVRNLVSPG